MTCLRFKTRVCSLHPGRPLRGMSETSELFSTWYGQEALLSLLHFCFKVRGYETAGWSWENAPRLECWECPQTDLRDKETGKGAAGLCQRPVEGRPGCWVPEKSTRTVMGARAKYGQPWTSHRMDADSAHGIILGVLPTSTLVPSRHPTWSPGQPPKWSPRLLWCQCWIHSPLSGQKKLSKIVTCTLLRCWWECKLVEALWRTVWRFL